MQLRNPRSLTKKKPPIIRTSQIVLGLSGCVIVGTLLLFGSSFFLFAAKNDNNAMTTTSSSSASSKTQKKTQSLPDHPVVSSHQTKTLTTPLTKTTQHNNNDNINNQLRGGGSAATSSLSRVLEQVKQDFYNRYGGRDTAETLFAKTITTFGDLDRTAQRILKSVVQQTPFVMGFAGYSITVGRGNYFHQSFPFVVERVLQESMKAVGVPNFIVRNSAIGGYVHVYFFLSLKFFC